MQKGICTILSALCLGFGVWLMIDIFVSPGPLGQLAAILIGLAVIFNAASRS